MTPCPRLSAAHPLLFLICVFLLAAGARAAVPLRFHQDQETGPVQSLVGTEIGDIAWSGRHLWVATERGLARLDPDSATGLSPAEWVTYTEQEGLGRGAVSAIAAKGDTVWAATLFDTAIADLGDHQVSGGLSFSHDGGQTWKHVPNQEIFSSFPKGPTTSIDNGCFGLALDGSTLWAAFFAGSLVRSRDQGRTWERVLPDGAREVVYFPEENAGLADSLRAQADSLARAGGAPARIEELEAQADSLLAQSSLHRTFAVLAYGDTVWVGTASGVARSFDGGRTWRNLKVRLDAQEIPIPGHIAGNWVVALERQLLPDGGSAIWAGTRSTATVPGEFDAISVSFDNGRTWENTGPAFAWDFAFTQDRVWASTEEGLYASADQGQTWEQVPVRDPGTGEALRGVFNGLETVGQVLWAGAENGLGRSADQGQTWRIVKSLVRPLSLDEGELIGEAGPADSLETYAAPNPFAPSQDEQARIVYSLSQDALVTIEIYDFASRRVRTLIAGQARAGRQNHASDAWDGKDDEGDPVANGVYFYRVRLDNGQEAFGKVVVLD